MTKKTSEPVEDVDSGSEESNIEAQPLSQRLTKTGKPKKEWVYTEARKQAFERARKAREEMGNTKKQIIQTKAELRQVKKEKLSTLKNAVEIQKQKKTKLQAKLAESSDESESPAPIIIKRVKKAKKKPVVYYESDSSASSDDVELPHRKSKPIVTESIRYPPRTNLFI